MRMVCSMPDCQAGGFEFLSSRTAVVRVFYFAGCLRRYELRRRGLFTAKFCDVLQDMVDLMYSIIVVVVLFILG